jgi:hypothetical protein
VRFLIEANCCEISAVAFQIWHRNRLHDTLLLEEIWILSMTVKNQWSCKIIAGECRIKT